MGRIPKIIHYCFGLTEDFGGKPWSLLHHVCVRSAIEAIRPDQVFFYYEYEPVGPWWEVTRPLVTPVPIRAPRAIFDRPVIHPAHRSDVVRLEKLIEHGGIYLDADVLVHRDFDDLLSHSTVLGEERLESGSGLANAVILAEPQAPFLKRWLAEYHWFRSKGRDEFWCEHSVKLPWALAKQHPEELTLLPYQAFYWPLWTKPHLEWMFASNKPILLEATYANHLWESAAWDYVEGLTPGQVRAVDTNFHRWARPLLEGLPDDYGAPTVRARVAQSARRIAKVSAPMTDLAGRAIAKARRQIGRVVQARRSVAPNFVPTETQRRQAFRDVYARGRWGSDGRSAFFSGNGSRGEAAEFYVDSIARLLAAHQAELGRPLTIVDLGCGDFEVGRALLRRLPDARYIGCDIVPELIFHHKTQNADRQASFQVVDMVVDPLPQGDVCLIRQVLQHLPNADVQHVLRKLNYRYTYITEGHPTTRLGPVNPDKSVGEDVRFDWRTGQGRGLELDQPPFSLRTREVFRTLRSPQEALITERVLLGADMDPR